MRSSVNGFGALKYAIALALAMVPGGVYAGDFTSSPSARHPQIFKSTFCVAQWVDLPGPRVWFAGFIKNTGPREHYSNEDQSL